MAANHGDRLAPVHADDVQARLLHPGGDEAFRLFAGQAVNVGLELGGGHFFAGVLTTEGIHHFFKKRVSHQAVQLVQDQDAFARSNPVPGIVGQVRLDGCQWRFSFLGQRGGKETAAIGK